MTQIFADCADIVSIRKYVRHPDVRGFTTNPTLMRKAGVLNYEHFCRDVLDLVPDRPVSFEVFADEPSEIVQQAHKISAWGDNVYVKVPVTTTYGDPLAGTIEKLSLEGVKVNVTAVFTYEQIREVYSALAGGVASFVSVFAGRIADTGYDPQRVVYFAANFEGLVGPHTRVIWASTREVYNFQQAERVGCHVITMTPDLIKKKDAYENEDLERFSLETVRMFHEDARAAGYFL